MLAIFHIAFDELDCITIIGIPFGLANFKLARVSFAPLGKKVVSIEMASEAKSRAAKDQLDKKLEK